MDLNTLWFALITVLFVGFLVLEGFDFGVGILLPWLGRDDGERRSIIATIGPVWDGNEVWILTAGGAVFAAFPHWYATLFSGFYLALLPLLAAMIVRGVAFEFRNRDSRPRWRRTWDWMIFAGSVIPALLWGVALANLLHGVPIDARKACVGGFLDLLSPYALVAGLSTLCLFTVHGAIFLDLRSSDPIRTRALRVARQAWPLAAIALAAFAAGSCVWTDALARSGGWPALVPLAAAGAMLAAGAFVRSGRTGRAFAMTSLAVVCWTAAIFVPLYPRVMVSTLRPAWSLTIYNASSTPYTLGVMSVVALVFVPIVLAYQAWTYWVFRRRIGAGAGTGY